MTGSTAWCSRGMASKVKATTWSSPQDPAVQVSTAGENHGFCRYSLQRDSAASRNLVRAKREDCRARQCRRLSQPGHVERLDHPQRGNAPFQPMVTVADGDVNLPAGTAGSSAGEDLPLGNTAQDVVFKHPDLVHVVG